MESQVRAAPPVTRESVCEAVVLAVAEAEGVEPEVLRPSLYEVIDPDALEQLYGDSQRTITADLSVTFGYGDWSVHVHSNGAVSVIERPGVHPEETPRSER